MTDHRDTPTPGERRAGRSTDPGRTAAPPREAPPEGPTFSGERARQGYIVLRTRRRRNVFVGGLGGLVVLALVVALLA